MELNTDVPHSARIYDYLLGGKDHFAADRDAAAAITADWPHLAISMRANRNYMARQARFIAAELGIRQFLDIGAGLPTSPNLHEVVQQVDPTSRVMYVDNDPIVLVHARALLTSAPEGQTTYLDANLRDPSGILESAEFRGTFDLSQPVALSLIAILQFVVDDDLAHRIIDTLMEPLPAGSVLAMSTVTADSAPDEVNKGVAAYVARGINEKARDRAECEDLFRGLELIDPGVVLVNHWRPDDAARAVPDEHVHMYGGVAIKR
ncbi:SAM-dependent methyltransferase [Actinoplanes sp. CA-142083]|uniref:SAM-dependent methyltransferase n=1 Tax=Actinoplanes sp. CA-142083 TaxID=3239903 RepID=UPI003D8CD799